MCHRALQPPQLLLLLLPPPPLPACLPARCPRAWLPQDADRRHMLYEERLEAAERRRLEGNALFADGKCSEALGKYAMVRGKRRSESAGGHVCVCVYMLQQRAARHGTLGRKGPELCNALKPLCCCCSHHVCQALSFCDEDFMLQLQGPHLDKAEAVTNPVLLNMAAVQLKIGDYATAAHNATQVRCAHARAAMQPGCASCPPAGQRASVRVRIACAWRCHCAICWLCLSAAAPTRRC